MNAEQKREAYKKWYYSEAGRRYLDKMRIIKNVQHKKYRQSDKGRETQRIKSNRHYYKHYEKNKVRRQVRFALQSGKLIKLPCDLCGNLKSQAHHDDYSKPLEVRWLCDLHHKQIEGKLKIPIPSRSLT